MSEKSCEEEIKTKAQQARRLARYMSSTHDLVESQIEKAMARGEFENLEGYGKPLNLYENPYEPPELRMTFKILKDNDFAPYWVELGKEIDADWEKIKKERERFTDYARIFYRERKSSAADKNFDRKKNYLFSECRRILQGIHKKILDFNLHCPTFRETRANINVDDEMFKIIEEVELIIEDLQKNHK